MKIVAVSGYFDPLHKGHVELFKLSKGLAGEGGKLIVILNNDIQTKNKKGYCFMSAEDKKVILEALEVVDEVFISVDEDRTICKSLVAVKPDIFANGGDRKKGGDMNNNTDIPELKICRELGIEMVDGVGEKIQSSSELVKNYEENKES